MPRSDDEPGVVKPNVALSSEVREHLGQKLRATLRQTADKPAFLGDESLPPEFEGAIRRLQGQDRTSRSGLDAVRNALGLNEAENREARRPRIEPIADDHQV